MTSKISDSYPKHTNHRSICSIFGLHAPCLWQPCPSPRSQKTTTTRFKPTRMGLSGARRIVTAEGWIAFARAPRPSAIVKAKGLEVCRHKRPPVPLIWSYGTSDTSDRNCNATTIIKPVTNYVFVAYWCVLGLVDLGCSRTEILRI